MLELYRQAQVPHTAIDPSNNMPYETTCFSADKFAELIVRECAIIDFCKSPAGLTGEQDNNVSKMIKQHFGVN
jgi:hypothetical protein